MCVRASEERANESPAGAIVRLVLQKGDGSPRSNHAARGALRVKELRCPASGWMGSCRPVMAMSASARALARPRYYCTSAQCRAWPARTGAEIVGLHVATRTRRARVFLRLQY